MVYQWLAMAVVLLHFGYLAYLVAGGYLAWRWPRTLALHLVAVVWAVLIVVTEVTCPLTWLQNGLRTRAGQPELELSFIDTYVGGVFFPADHEVAARLLVALLVAVSWFGLASRTGHWRRPVGSPSVARLNGHWASILRAVQPASKPSPEKRPEAPARDRRKPPRPYSRSL